MVLIEIHHFAAQSTLPAPADCPKIMTCQGFCVLGFAVEAAVISNVAATITILAMARLVEVASFELASVTFGSFNK